MLSLVTGLLNEGTGSWVSIPVTPKASRQEDDVISAVLML